MLDEELAFAHELADRAAEIGLSFFRGEFEVRQKPDLTPVTEADLAIESMVREQLASRFPGDAVQGEEGGLVGEGPRTWIVDPIDGTENFAAGIPIWCTLLALRVDKEFVLGLASAPSLRERYDAIRGSGARCNGRPIHVSEAGAIPESMLVYGDVEPWLGSEPHPGFLGLLGDARRSRGFGDFWGHVLVARGSAEIMIEPELRLWDFAALVPILTEAGGRISQIDGSPLAEGGSCLSTNGLVHASTIERMRTAHP